MVSVQQRGIVPMPELHQSASVAARMLDALDQIEGADKNTFRKRLWEYPGGGLGTEIENLDQVTIPADPAFAYGGYIHVSCHSVAFNDTSTNRRPNNLRCPASVAASPYALRNHLTYLFGHGQVSHFLERSS